MWFAVPRLRDLCAPECSMSGVQPHSPLAPSTSTHIQTALCSTQNRAEISGIGTLVTYQHRCPEWRQSRLGHRTRETQPETLQPGGTCPSHESWLLHMQLSLIHNVVGWNRTFVSSLGSVPAIGNLDSAATAACCFASSFICTQPQATPSKDEIAYVSHSDNVPFTTRATTAPYAP